MGEETDLSSGGNAREGNAMKFEILYPGAYSMLKVVLEKGEHVKAESGAMLSMSGTMDVEGKLEGGLMSGLARKFLTGETLFFQTLRATRGPGEVLLASAIPGDTALLELDGSVEYILQKDGFLCGTPDLKLATSAQNLTKGLFSGEGFFIQKISGRGTLAVSSFGSIHRIDLSPGEVRVIDNGHLVAWPSSVSYELQKASASGWFSSLTSGEGVVCRFKGPGHVFVQSRNAGAFGSWIRKFIKVG